MLFKMRIRNLSFSLLLFLSKPSYAACAESNVSRRRRVSMQTVMGLPVCDSERPNSWATHRTLMIPESCITGLAMEIAMMNALCCVYTHVVVVGTADEETSNRPYLETYDGSLYAYNECENDSSADAYTSIEAMEEVMGNVCGMSMGSRDCFDQRFCIEDAMAIPAPADVVDDASTGDSPDIPTSPSPTGSSISTVIPTFTTSDFFDDDDGNSTTLSPFPSSSSPPSQIQPTIPPNLSVSSFEYPFSSSGSLPAFYYKSNFFVCFCCLSAFYFLV